MQRSQILSISRELISQEDTANTDFSDTELTAYADEGVRFLAALVKWPRRKDTFTPTLGTQDYTLQADAILILNAYYGDPAQSGEPWELDVMDEEELRALVPSWFSSHITNRGKPSRIILKDRATVSIQPRPDANAVLSGKLLYLTIVYSPAALSADSSTPDLPIAYHDLIPDYIQYKAFLGKLKKQDEAPGVLKSIVDRAKLLEPVVVKEHDLTRMFWGRHDSLDDDGNEELILE